MTLTDAIGYYLKSSSVPRADTSVKKVTTRTTERKNVTLDRGEGTTLVVQLQGCVITSWRVHNIEQLFVPVTADYSPLVRFKGGITLTFPYAPHSELREVYELVRLYHWKVFMGPKMTRSGDVTATFLMKDDLWTRSVWDYPFLFFYKIILRQRSVTCDLRVINTGKDLPFDFKFHLSMNFQVKRVEDWKLEGLKNEIYADKNVVNIPYLENTKTDENEAVIYGKKMFRIYQPSLPGTPLYFLQKRDECEVRQDGLEPYKRIVKITKINFPEVTVRYPWTFPEKHTDHVHEKHLINDAKRDAVIVGTGYINKSKKLQPGDMYRAVMKISILPEEKLTTTMAEMEVTDLRRQEDLKGPQKDQMTFDLEEICQDENRCHRVARSVPLSGSIGFGSWSLT
uniref:Putative glucose-6-phosphate 1-epimerase n=1 Tax=Lygus hesperus TaxID=30085 RepID=A0A0A9W0Q1_LYGHE